MLVATTSRAEGIIEYLLEKNIDPDQADLQGNTPFIIAAVTGQTKIMEKLLATGKVAVDSKGQDGLTALAYAGQNSDEKVVEIILDAGANINLTDDNGNTALMHAAGTGNTSMVALLLKRNADPNLKQNQGFTALMVAANRNDEAMVKLLLDEGANPELADNQSRKAVDLTNSLSIKEILGG